MERGIWLMSTAFVVVVLAYAALATIWVSADPGWYSRLAKPWFQPPDLVFGLIWPLNFLALGVVGVLIGRGQPTRVALPILLVLAASIVFALGWAWLFYVPHSLGWAAVSLGVAATLTWLLVVLAWRADPAYGLAWVVYAAWLSIATALSVGYARLN